MQTHHEVDGVGGQDTLRVRMGCVAQLNWHKSEYFHSVQILSRLRIIIT